MDSVLGTTFLRGNDMVNVDELLSCQEFVGLYFGAHWAPPCRLFTENLKDFTEKLREQH